MTAPLALPLACVLDRYQPQRTDPPARKLGRPVKRTHEYFALLLAEHARLVDWFEASHGAKPASDRQLYTDFFGQHFLAAGGRATRATSPDFQGPLKTLCNELAEARRLHRTHPGNDAISGMSALVKSGHATTLKDVQHGRS